MNRKHIYSLITCFILSIVLVVTLAAISGEKKSIKNGFTRNITYNTPLLKYSLELNSSNYYIAGITENNIFLGNTSQPTELFKTSFKLTDTVRYTLTYPEKVRAIWEAGRIYVDSQTIIFGEGTTPVFLQGNMNDRILKTVVDTVPYFSRYVPASPSSVLMKIHSAKLQQELLIKYSPSETNMPTQHYILEKQIDGTFCTQGVLNYNRSGNNVIYTYLYRNQFVCLDTNLNVIYKANTIDTNTVAKLEIKRLDENRMALASPPSVVNKYTCVDNSVLYVQSELFGDNEDYRDFKNLGTIDAYSLKDGKYIGSFYLPVSSEKQRLVTFEIRNNLLFALYAKSIKVYELAKLL